MADYPPFMNSYGLVSKILNKVKEAKTPDRFTQDYLGETLGFSSGSAKPFIPLAKRMGLLSSDGAPTELYKQFRNPDHSKTAMGTAIRRGFATLYERNENVHSSATQIGGSGRSSAVWLVVTLNQVPPGFVSTPPL